MLKITLICCLVASAFGAGIPRQPLKLSSGRIVGGGLADEGEYPSQVSLQFYTEHSCGASILNEKYALTAGHCVNFFNTSSLNVRSGSLESSKGTKHQVVNFILHEGYDPENSYNNDIAILEVDEPFVFGPNVQPVKLPNQNDETEAGASAVVIGWGVTDEGTRSPVLKEATMEMIGQTDCFDTFSDVGLEILPGQICANDVSGGSCNSDSGGPLFVDGVVVGLVSWGYNGCTGEYPTVHARVAYYRDWIFQHTGV